MEAAARLSALHAAPPLLGELGLLADATRGRMLACLDGVEMTVVELCDSLALPQSTVSRHLKQLADAGWVDARRDGTSRRYALTIDRLDERSRRLWEIVHESLAESRRRAPRPAPPRAGAGSAAQRDTQAFFSDVADEWDRAARRAVRRDERPAAAARPARPRCRRRRPRLRLGSHRGDDRALCALGRRRRLLARDARRRALAPRGLRQRRSSSRAASRISRSSRSRSTSRSSSTSCTM